MSGLLSNVRSRIYSFATRVRKRQLIANSQTTALSLALASLSAGREVIVSRSHLIEIADELFRLHHLFFVLRAPSSQELAR